MVEDLIVVAPGVVDGIREDRDLVESPLVVARLGYAQTHAVVAGSPAGAEVQRAQWAADDVAEHLHLLGGGKTGAFEHPDEPAALQNDKVGTGELLQKRDQDGTDGG